MNEIRKISIGKGHPNEMMHYQVNKEVNLSGNTYIISDIILDRDLLRFNKLSYNVYILNNEKGKVLWKSITDVPMVIEYNIDFD